MKKNLYKLFLCSSVIMILILSCFMLCILLEQRKKEKNNNELNLIKSKKLTANLYFKQNIQEATINNNLYVNLCSRDNINKNNKTVLVFRYSAFNCVECIEFGNKKVKEFFNDYRIDQDVLFISSDYNFEEPTHNKNHLDLKKEKLGLPIEYTNQPFFFVLESNQVKHVFIPDKEYPECTDIYLYEVKKRYFPDNSNQ